MEHDYCSPSCFYWSDFKRGCALLEGHDCPHIPAHVIDEMKKVLTWRDVLPDDRNDPDLPEFFRVEGDSYENQRIIGTDRQGCDPGLSGAVG